MPVPNKMGKSLPPDELAAVHTALDSATNTINKLFAINLTKDERQGIQSVAETRLPYLQKAFDALVPGNPNFRPPFGDLDEANADYAYLRQLLDLDIKLKKLVEICSDHELAAGYRAFEYMRDFYHLAQRGAERNVPGADTVVDELSPLFEVSNPATSNPAPANGGNPVV